MSAALLLTRIQIFAQRLHGSIAESLHPTMFIHLKLIQLYIITVYTDFYSHLFFSECIAYTR